MVDSYIKDAKLPFKPKLNNILLFEKILEVKSYAKLSRIVFVIEIPIVEKESYNYFHLYSLPVPHNDMYKIILPNSKYIILNEHYFSSSERKCQEVTEDNFLCGMNPTEIKGNNLPCEVELLKLSENPENCKQGTVQISSLKIQNIENGKWIAIIPERVVGLQHCEEGKENIPLKGTYLIELPHRCKLKLGNTELKTYQDENEQIKWVKIPNLNTSFLNKETLRNNPKPIELATVELDEFKHIQHTLDRQRDRLEEIPEVPIHFHKASFWTILLYALIIITFAYFAFRFYIKRRKTKESDSNKKPSTSHQDIALEDIKIQKHPPMF